MYKINERRFQDTNFTIRGIDPRANISVYRLSSYYLLNNWFNSPSNLLIALTTYKHVVLIDIKSVINYININIKSYNVRNSEH